MTNFECSTKNTWHSVERKSWTNWFRSLTNTTVARVVLLKPLALGTKQHWPQTFACFLKICVLIFGSWCKSIRSWNSLNLGVYIYIYLFDCVSLKTTELHMLWFCFLYICGWAGHVPFHLLSRTCCFDILFLFLYVYHVLYSATYYIYIDLHAKYLVLWGVLKWCSFCHFIVYLDLNPSKEYGTCKLNRALRILYGSDLWIENIVAVDVSDCLTGFLKAQCKLAYIYTFEEEAARFGQFPKVHMVHHIAFELKRCAKLSAWVLNPITETCSMDEDFVGKCAAITRKVSPRLCSLRSLERYLAQLCIMWA